MTDRTDAFDNRPASPARVAATSTDVDSRLESISMSELLTALRGRPSLEVRRGMVRAGDHCLSATQRAGFFAVVQATMLGLLEPSGVAMGTWREVAQDALWRLSTYDHDLALQMVRMAAA